MFSFSANLYYDARRISKKDNTASLFLMVIVGGEKKPFALKLRWLASKIDVANGKLLPREKNDPEVYDYNLLIQAEKAKYTEIQRTYRIRKETLTLAKFKKEIHVFNDRECFVSYMERERNIRYNKKDIDKKTWQNVHAVKMQVVAYDPIASFKDIDAKWMNGFKNYLRNNEFKPGQFYMAGTIWDRIRTVKTYLNRAAQEPMIFVNPDARKFSNKKATAETVYLNKDELTRLIILFDELLLTETQYQVLGAFLFTCFTSLRISDVYLANKSWEVRTDILKFMPYKNRKSRKVIEIPIMPMAKSFINNLTGNFFTLPTQQEYNRTLKYLAEKAEISKNLTSHVGRHTFGYLYMQTCGNLMALKEIFGHVKLETTERYAHLDEEYKIKSVKDIQDSFTDFRVRLRIK